MVAISKSGFYYDKSNCLKGYKSVWNHSGLALTNPHLAQAEVKKSQNLLEAAELTLVCLRAHTRVLGNSSRERGGRRRAGR